MGKYTLWQGTDHLLHIFTRFGVEDYKRFYLDDIQAVITRKTIAGKAQNVILGCLISLFLLFGFLFDGGGSIFCGIVTAMLFILLLRNLYLGPTCETMLTTAVQTERLQSLQRLKAAFKVMDGLRLDIQQAQGPLNREDLIKIPARPVGRHTAQGLAQPNVSPAESVKHDNGRVHMILFTLLLVNGGWVTAEFFFSQVVLTILSSVTSLCIGVFVIFALVRQSNTDLPGSLRMMTWTSLGFVGVTFVIGYFEGMVFAFNNPSIAYNQWEIVKSISNLSPWDSHLKLSYNILILCGAIFIGIPGLIMQNRFAGKANPNIA